MRYFMASLQTELLKARKSKVIWLTAAAFSIAPLVGAFFMFVLKNPELAENAGLLGTKAQIAGEATWPSYLSLLAQMIAVGGIFVFGFVMSWLFGREYAEHTLKDLLALPNRRTMTVLAKFVAGFFINSVLSIHIIISGILLGFAVGLPGWTEDILMNGIMVLALVSVLTMASSTPVAWMACYGKGYMAPLGFVVVTVVLSQIIAAAGYGEYFPWSIPVLVSGITGTAIALTGVSLSIVLAAFLFGLFSTFAWWLFADQY